MEWADDGIVLSTRAHGETSAIAVLLTRHHGRHAGLVHGGRGRRLAGTLEPGNRVQGRWRGRLPDQLGSFAVELVRHGAGPVFERPDRLAGLAAAVAVTEAVCPEHEPLTVVFDALAAFLDLLPDSPFWAEAYVRWELGLLAALGYGLDLTRCAATGVNDQLAYVSPRTGRAVSLSAGEPFRDRLLRLPGFLIGRGGGGPVEVTDGLKLTGHFLERHLLASAHLPLPPPRGRLAALIAMTRTPEKDPEP